MLPVPGKRGARGAAIAITQRLHPRLKLGVRRRSGASRSRLLASRQETTRDACLAYQRRYSLTVRHKYTP